MAPAGRLAAAGLDEAPLRWVSELAEELAAAIELNGGGPVLISHRIREVAAERKITDRWLVAQLVAREWDRLGIRRVPGILQAGGF